MSTEDEGEGVGHAAPEGGVDLAVQRGEVDLAVQREDQEVDRTALKKRAGLEVQDIVEEIGKYCLQTKGNIMIICSVDDLAYLVIFSVGGSVTAIAKVKVVLHQEGDVEAPVKVRAEAL